MKTVKSAKELGEAIKNKEEYIYIEGDLKNRIIKIKATGKIAWAIAGVAIASAVGLYLSAPATAVATAPAGGVGSVVSFGGSAVAAGAATTILGINATAVAMSVAIAAGGIGAINLLRDDYKIVRNDNKGMLLERKS